MQTWNDHRGDDLPAAVGLHPRRREAILARIAEKPDAAYWTATVKRIAESDFLSGRKPGRNGKVFDGSLDWLIGDAEWHVAVNEGRYDNARDGGKAEPRCHWCADTGVAFAHGYNNAQRQFGCPSCKLGHASGVPRFSDFRDSAGGWEFVKRWNPDALEASS